MEKIITKKVSIQIFALLIFLFLMVPVQCQEGILTLEDLYVNYTYSSERFGPVKWYKNGEGYTSLEQSADNKGREKEQRFI